MKKVVRILVVVMWVLLVAGFLVLVGFTTIDHNDTVCRSYSVSIDYGKADTLITRADVDSLLKGIRNPLKGQFIGDIDVEKVEKSIKHQPYVGDADVFMYLDGKVVVNIIQRQPILRIYNTRGESFYLDGRGNLLPLNPAFSARVLVANGDINEPFVKRICYQQDSVKIKDSLEYKSIMNHLYEVASYIAKDPFFRAQIQQIYVNPDGEMELIPRVGNHTILLGKGEDLPEKFGKLYVFYKMGLSQTGWEKYNIINIKYRNQVVCSKI
ncbi:MAG: cell division protein FtsQ/DivIB [Syntrophothermus sp.]